MQTLHFTLAASDCLPPALEMLQLSLHSLHKTVQGKKKERSWMTDGQEKRGACSAPSQQQRMHRYVFLLGLSCFGKWQHTAIASAGFAKRQPAQGQSRCTFRKAKPGNCFSELSRLQPLSRADGFNQSSFHHCHEAKSHTHSGPRF